MKSPEQGITTPLTAETVKNIRARFEKFAQGHVGVTIFSGPDLGNMQIEAEGEISVLNMENGKIHINFVDRAGNDIDIPLRIKSGLYANVSIFSDYQTIVEVMYPKKVRRFILTTEGYDPATPATR